MNFINHAHDVYVEANRAALYWQLGRMQATRPFINTKVNSLSLKDYGEKDGLRGPEYVYGWIQGRGLEALILHARYFEELDSHLSKRLYGAAQALYLRLRELIELRMGAHFCYNAVFEPIRCDDPLGLTPQPREPDIATYSDLFCVKGLIAAASKFSSDDLSSHLSSLARIIDCIERDRFLMNESGDITNAALSDQLPDFGPRMIALGAAALLHQLGLGKHDTFSNRFIDHVLDRHLDAQHGLLCNEPGGNLVNVGHGIEFAGFAFDTQRLTMNKCLAVQLSDIINNSFQAGFNGTGICTLLDLTTMKPVNTLCPWWSLPETIRAASLAYEVNADSASLKTWETAHKAFFTYYWQTAPPIAYQSLKDGKPVDAVPATPDLDPGYHTGLSLLGAIQMVERQQDQGLTDSC